MVPKTISSEALGNYLQLLSDTQKKTVAGHPSSYSHLSKWKFHEECFKSAHRAVFCLLAAGGLAVTPLEEEYLKRRMSIICSRYRVQGEWKLVSKLIKLPFAPGLQLQAAYDYYGSYRRIFSERRLFSSIYRGLKRVPSESPFEPRVKHSNRKRGYGDKGRLRSSCLNDIRYWRVPGAPLVKYTLDHKWFLPDWYVTKAEPERQKLAGDPGGGSRVLNQYILEVARLRALLKEIFN